MKLLLKFIQRKQHFILLLFLIALAFSRCIESVAGLNYGYDFDSERDLSSVHNLIEGKFGADPSYLGEYMWYNPLITFLEVSVIELTGFSPGSVVTRSGAFLNIICAILFYMMTSYLFNSKIAIAATASFLFFSGGNLPSWASATYSPWLYPVNFMQAIFYLGIIVYSRAFIKPGNFRFLCAGFITGIVFLGHTAPAAILLLIMALLLLREIFVIYKSRFRLVGTQFIKYGFIFGISFLFASLPLLFFVVGKYKLHMVNFATYEFTDPLFAIRNFPALLMENLSFAFFISAIGFYFLYFKYTPNIKRDLILAWFIVSLFLFAYTTMVPFVRFNYNIIFPGLVPSFHFFFYLKALQAVLFGVGFCGLLDIILKKFVNTPRGFRVLFKHDYAGFVTLTILALALSYYPVYSRRADFVTPRERALKRNAAKNEIEIYNWILKKTNINDVFVCDEDYSTFPVMASGRKLVAVIPTMSNPYISYLNRDRDRNIILNSLLYESFSEAIILLNKYNVGFILLENKMILNQKSLDKFFGLPVFKSEKFIIYKHKASNKPININ